MFDECPICKDELPMIDRYIHKECQMGHKTYHRFSFSYSDKNITAIRYEVFLPNEINHVYLWTMVDLGFTISFYDRGKYVALHRYPYFEPNFDDLPALHSRIQTILTFS